MLIASNAPSWAEEDREAGRDVFAYSAACIACHAIGSTRDQAPKLGGIIGRRAGTDPDYDGYSDAMKSSDVVWTQEPLDAYIGDPAALIPGNGMAPTTGKLEDETQRRDLIAFLKEPGHSVDLCL
jgi:cytochrome c2